MRKDKFKEQFGLEWDDVLKDGKALNATDCLKKFEIDADELDKMWGAAKKSKNLVKFGGGLMTPPRGLSTPRAQYN